MITTVLNLSVYDKRLSSEDIPIQVEFVTRDSCSENTNSWPFSEYKPIEYWINSSITSQKEDQFITSLGIVNYPVILEYVYNLFCKKFFEDNIPSEVIRVSSVIGTGHVSVTFFPDDK